MELTKKSKSRLMRLVEFMEKLPTDADKHFHMRHVVSHEGEGHSHNIPESPTKADLMTCGTTACAIGWATAMPYFRKLGLRVVRWQEWGGEVQYLIDGHECFDLGRDYYEQEKNFDKFFGMYNKARTPKAWAKRARALIKKARTI